MSQLNPRPTRSAALQALLDEAEAELVRTKSSPPASRIPTQTHRTAGGVSSRPVATPAGTTGPVIGAQRQSPDPAPSEGPASAQVWETAAPRRARVTRTVLSSPTDGPGGRRGRAARSRRVTGPSRGRRRHGRRLRKPTRARTHCKVAGYGLLRLSRSGRGRSVQVRRLIRAAATPTVIAPAAWSTAPVTASPTAVSSPAPASLDTPDTPDTVENRASFAPRSPAEVAAAYFASTPLTPEEISARDRGAKRSEHQRRRALVVAMAAVAAVVGAVFLLTWQLGRDRTPQPPASPASATTPAAPTAAPAVPVTSSAGAPPGRPVTTEPVAVARATTKPAPTSTGAPAVLPIPSGPTSVRPGDSHQGTVVAGSTRLTGWVLVPSSP